MVEPVVLTGRPATGAIAAAWLRRWLWRVVFFLLGGVSVSGKLPTGGCVVVANHVSHADSVALITAIRAHHAPRFAAARDYWFHSRLRRFACSVLVSTFPVHRSHKGYGELDGVGVELLRKGHAVVVFPEGSRNQDATRFRRGAFALAEAAGTPVVPVAVCGTDELLPKGGWLRPRPVGVRIGAPLENPSAERARAAVAELAEGYEWRDSRTRRRVARFAASRWGLLFVALWAAAEAVSWPLLSELLLGVLCAAAPRVAPRLIATTVLAGVAGGVLMLLLYTSPGAAVPQPLTTARMHATAAEQISREGADAVWNQPPSGIPYKVYSAEAGKAGVPAAEWAWNSLQARGLRVVCVVGAVLALIGLVAQRLRRFFVPYVLVLCAAVAAALYVLVGMWS
ncbi:1-acyl-sn-glycerol-3-phosphate acyltransferase [Amycolatopsis suaedae]|uniref:1-acyl-sn-glycerol-3-phosphate acyltransferase n=2 Tax=Amycolatopsis suaedae TaxID=2510978 RepID=A0A4V2EMF7_9PSEU|nr:1-acyl-sn-glycerol-3-phosphate acyltransferase [Amycolatopsis suaedae]